MSEDERNLRKLIQIVARQIQRHYQTGIIDVTTVVNLFRYRGKVFNLDVFPELKVAFNKVISSLHGNIETTIVNAINTAWQLSNEKNDLLAKGFLSETTVLHDLQAIILNRNDKARESFISRAKDGVNLSDRIWKATLPYRHELEAGFADGLAKGESAAKIASKLKLYLNNPDKLFRRTRDKNGRLQLSQAARNYHPGPGVYRSSYKNTLRLTATETNIAYRTSDNLRWKAMPFVKGIRIQTSNNHPFYDECNILQGDYPKDFKFVGWHPHCRCFSTPIGITKEQSRQLGDYNLGISDKKPDIDYIDDVPSDFKKYVSEHAKDIKEFKSKPYFIRDNRKYTKPLIHDLGT